MWADVNEEINVNFIPGGVMSTCHVSQYDTGYRKIIVNLYSGSTPYTFHPTMYGVSYYIILKVRKPDGNIVTLNVTPGETSTTRVTIITTEQMVAVAGKNICELSVQDAETNPTYVVASANFIMEVEKDPTYGGLTSESDIYNLEQQIRDITASEMGNYYTKSEADVKFADVSNVYTKSAADEKFADASNVYTKSEADELLDEKVNESDVYKKYTVDNLLYGKADKSDIQTVLHTYTLDTLNPEITGFGSIEDMYTVWTDNFGSEINLRDSASMQGSIAGSIADNEMFFPVETVTGDTVEGNSNWAKINDSEYDYVYASCRYLLTTKGVRFTNQNVSGIPIRILNADIKLNQRGIGVSHPTNIRKISGRQSIVITNGTERTDVTIPGSHEYTIPLGQTIYDGRLLIAQARSGSIAIHVTSDTNGISMKDLDWQYDEDLQYFYAIIDGMKIADSGTLKLEGSLYSYYTSGSGNIDNLPTYCMTNYHSPAGECVVINDPSYRNLDTFLYAIDHLNENEDIIVYPAEEATSILIRNYTDHILTVSSDNIVMIPGCDITSITVDIVTDVKEDIQALNNDVDEVNERIDDLILDQYPVNEFSSTPIATLTDGAENVPMKSLIVDIVPKQASGTPTPSSPLPISGFTGANITHTGKNLFDYNNYEDIVVTSGGYVRKGHIFPSGTYTIINNSSTEDFYYKLIKSDLSDYGSAQQVRRGNSANVTVNSGYIVAVYSAITPTGIFVGIGADQTYKPYTGTIYPISWQTEAGTVYGGWYNVTTGKLTVTFSVLVDLGDLTWSTDSNGYAQAPNIPNIKTTETQYVLSGLICDKLVTDTQANVYGKVNDNTISGATTNQIRVYISAMSGKTAAQVKSYLAGYKVIYPLATPIEYTLTPTQIKTLGGIENIFADCGNVEGEYYVDPSYKEITGTLAAGETSITLYSSLITSDSTLDFYADKGGVNYTDAIATDGSVTITFEPQASDIGVKVKIS